MTAKKGWASTVAGWFVERPDGGPSEQVETPVDSAADDVIQRELARSQPTHHDYTTPSPTQDVFKTAPPAATGGQVDFDAVYEAAGVDQEERDRVVKATELLKSLPADTDATVKKQIVSASLKAFSIPIEKIIEAGVQQIQALDGYIRNGAADTEKLTQESEQRIRQYEEEIANLRQIMQERVKEQQSVITVCNNKKLEVQQILEFFGQDTVARVVKASPKLHDPSEGAGS